MGRRWGDDTACMACNEMGEDSNNNDGMINYAGWWFEPLWKILVNWDDYS